MRIISVAGATSKAGKTLLAEQIIRFCADRYQPVYGVKFTTTSDLPSPCPRGAPCNVCDLSDVFRIVRDPETLMEKGKNTQRLAAAGATKVLWVISRKSYLQRAYEHLMQHIPEDAIIVMEGSTVTDFSRPDMMFYIVANHIRADRWKDSAGDLMARADFVLCNRRIDRPDAPGLPIPERATRIDIRNTPVTSLPAVAERLESLIRSHSHAIHNP